jgi:hypothetical protein
VISIGLPCLHGILKADYRMEHKPYRKIFYGMLALFVSDVFVPFDVIKMDPIISLTPITCCLLKQKISQTRLSCVAVSILITCMEGEYKLRI